FDRLQISPAPKQRVPIYVGGHTKPAIRRTVKYADGWTSAMLTTPQIAELVSEIKAALKEAGRENDPFEYQVTCMDAYNKDGFKRLEEVGVTDAIVQPWLFYGVAMNGSLQEKQDGMKRFAEQVIHAD
ncbi:MAG: LLM class flavin-dependent oxidoreductase, partial [Myxococcales bacterium]|nr:LLM class flavin-dependent oxidoreductase [Myxococcales bacterium]